MCDSNYSHRNCCFFVARISIKGLCKFFIQLTFTLRASPTHSHPFLHHTVGVNYGISYVCCSCSCATFFYQNFTCHFGTIAFGAHHKREPFSCDLWCICYFFLCQLPKNRSPSFFNSRNSENSSQQSELPGKLTHSFWYSSIRLITFYSVCFTAFHFVCTDCGRPIFMRYYCMNVSVPWAPVNPLRINWIENRAKIESQAPITVDGLFRQLIIVSIVFFDFCYK